MKRLLCAFLMFYGSLVTPAFSELTYQELQHSYAQSEGEGIQLLDNYLIGVYEGINATNLAFYMQTKQFMFCKAQSIDLNVGDLRRIIEDAHKSFDQNNDIPVSYLLFIGMRKTFPCL